MPRRGRNIDRTARVLAWTSRVLLLTLAGVGLTGCIMYRTQAFVSGVPRLQDGIHGIGSLSTADHCVHVDALAKQEKLQDLISHDGQPLKQQTVAIGERFFVRIFNGREQYELREVGSDSTVFFVKRDIMSCVYPFVRHITHDLVRVRPYDVTCREPRSGSDAPVAGTDTLSGHGIVEAN